MPSARGASVVRAVVGLERLLARVLVALGRPVRVHGFTGFGGDGWAEVAGRVLVGAPPRAAVPGSGRWTVVRANLLPFLTVEVAGAHVEVEVGGRRAVVRADGDGYVRTRVVDVRLDPGEHPVVLRPVRPAGAAATATVHVPHPDADLAVVSDVDDTIVDSGIAHGLAATLRTMLLQEQATRVPLAGAAELYRALARVPAGSPARPFAYVSTSPWNLQDFLHGFLARHGFPAGPLVLTDWGPGAESLFRVSSRTHKLEALRGMAAALPRTRFVLVGDSGQQDPEIYAEFCREHPGRAAAVYVRIAGSPGDARAERAVRALAGCDAPHLVTGDSAEVLAHATALGLVHP